MKRYLLGPISARLAEQLWKEPRRQDACRAFNASGDLELTVRPQDNWDDVCRRLGTDWRPDFVLLYLPYNTIAPGLWSAPVPLIGLAEDWNLLWHGYRRLLPCCDWVLTDTPGVGLMQRAGWSHVHPANLFGAEHAWVHSPAPTAERDIDILFVGNMNPAVQRERMSWLGRLARLGQRWRVHLATGVFDQAYRELLARARIVFNHSIRGECNRRVFEAIVSGALLFQEAGNAEVANCFRDRQECVCYTDEDLEDLLEHYLTHEDQRSALAAAARDKVKNYSCASLWEATLARLEAHWPLIQERARKRRRFSDEGALLARVWQSLGGGPGNDPALVSELSHFVGRQPSAELHNALGVVLAANQSQPRTAQLQQVAGCFHQALACNPHHPVATLNLLEALVSLGQTQLAVKGAHRLLAVLNRGPLPELSSLDGGHYPPRFDVFRVEWERAAWENAGKPRAEVKAKCDLLRWRAHALLADLTGDLAHYHEAALARPHLPATRAALGCALAREKRLGEAVHHLSVAVQKQPFDIQAARALYQTMLDSGDRSGADALAEERLLLHRAAPGLVPPDPWFARPPGQDPDPAPRTPARIVWEGPLRARHSLGLVNRQLSLQLLHRGHEVRLLPLDPPQLDAERVTLPDTLRECCRRSLSGPADVHVRLHWPPNFTPPAEGAWVLLQPWEYGSLPKDWIEPINARVDEVWAPTQFVRNCFVQSGIAADRVQVVPLGVNVQVFHPAVSPLPLRTRKTFKFLFVGGTIHRKGIDVLLRAYDRAFSSQDDVCLVIKDMGIGSFYQNQTAEKLITQLQTTPGAPEIEYLSEGLSEEQMPGLYTACNCLVQPYRGEGFGLPLVEAMACGLPVIVTGYGAALDFCDQDSAFLIPSQLVRFDQKRLGELETVDYPWLAEPDEEVLAALLRRVIQAPQEAGQKAQAGRIRVCRDFTWERSAQVVEQRLQALRQQRPRRGAPAPLAAVNKVTLTRRPPGQRVSLCLIAKNEEQNLSACLTSASGLFDEIIVIDTGSTDRTRELAAQLGARVFSFAWCDSFSAARNEWFKHATGDWIFWLDADDRLDELNRRKLKSLLDHLPASNVGFRLKCICVASSPTDDETVVDHIRLFRNHPHIRWSHRVHEQILGAIRASGGEICKADVVIQHTGYTDPVLRRRKLDRDLRLLRMEYQEQPEHPFTLFNLGSVLQDLGQSVEALTFLRRSLELSQPNDSIVRKLYALIIACHNKLGQPDQALAACLEGLKVCPEDAELLFVQGNLRLERGDLPGAEGCYRRLLESRSDPQFASVVVGLRGFKARSNLAVVLCRQGRPAEAEQQWRAALNEHPQFMPALNGLAELYLEQKRWAEGEEVLRQREKLVADPLDALVMRARIHLARQEFSAARPLLNQAIKEFPQALWPRLILTHVLLQEHTDCDAAEKALRDVLALAPDHVQARQNLEALLRERAEEKREWH